MKDCKKVQMLKFMVTFHEIIMFSRLIVEDEFCYKKYGSFNVEHILKIVFFFHVVAQELFTLFY